MANRIGAVAVTIGYPVVVLIALRYGGLSWLGGVTILVGAMRTVAVGVTGAWDGRRLDGIGIVLMLIGAVTLVGQTALAARLYPAFVNYFMLGYFGWSLLRPPSAVERFARLKQADLPLAAVTYTRRVTQVWCGFFLLNGSVAVYTAFWTSFETWALYNGIIAYVAMGSLFAAEYFVRRRVMRSHEMLGG